MIQSMNLNIITNNNKTTIINGGGGNSPLTQIVVPDDNGTLNQFFQDSPASLDLRQILTAVKHDHPMAEVDISASSPILIGAAAPSSTHNRSQGLVSQSSMNTTVLPPVHTMMNRNMNGGLRQQHQQHHHLSRSQPIMVVGTSSIQTRSSTKPATTVNGNCVEGVSNGNSSSSVYISTSADNTTTTATSAVINNDNHIDYFGQGESSI